MLLYKEERGKDLQSVFKLKITIYILYIQPVEHFIIFVSLNFVSLFEGIGKLGAILI